MEVGRELQVAEADEGEALRHARCRAPAACVMTPSASRSELQKTASGRAPPRISSASARAAAAQRRRRRHDDDPRIVEAEAARGRLERDLAPLRALVARRRSPPGGAGPRACRKAATPRPTSSCEKPTSMSIGVGVRSQVSTTGMPAPSRRLPALGRMHDAGQHDAVGAAADDRAEQRVLAVARRSRTGRASAGSRARPALRSATAPSAGTPARRSSARPPRPGGCASTPGRRPASSGRSRCARSRRRPSCEPPPRPDRAC